MFDHLRSNLFENNKKRSALTAYLAGVVFFILTLCVKLTLDPYIEFKGVPYLFAFTAIVLTASYGGIMPGIFTAVLASLSTNYLFVEPRTSIDILLGQTNVLRILAFMVEGTFISYLVGNIRNTKKEAVINEKYLRGVLDKLREALSENKKLYREVKRQKKTTDNIIANIPGVVWELQKKTEDEQFELNFISDYEEVILGYKIDNYKSNPYFWKDIIYEEDKNRVLGEINKVYLKQKPNSFQFRCVANNGKIIWVDAKFTVDVDEEGKSIGVEGVLTDITERIKTEQIKDEFVNIASHEIKTPLTTIKAFSQIIEKQIRQNQTKKTIGYLQKMNLYIIRLNGIVNDFMDFSKIESGKLEYYKEEFCLNELVGEVVDDMRSINKTFNIFFACKSKGMVWGDKNRISQVLINLISNAIKYSPETKKIMVSVEEKEDQAIINIIDYGIGIPKDSQKKIFEKFYRVSHPKKRDIEGFGLGLYISAEIIKRHKGKIWLESEVGKGSSFHISLPLVQKYE